MKVLITGGYGFIGSSIAQRLYKEGYKIFVIDNLSTGKKENLIVKHKFYNLDINDLKCEKVFKLHKFDLVIHCATIDDTALLKEDSTTYRNSNTMGLINILQLSVKNDVKSFIYPSSSQVYGDNNSTIFSEDYKANPSTTLGLDKSIGESLCLKWCELYNLNTIILRIGSLYGPKQNIEIDSQLVPFLMKKIYAEEPLPSIDFNKEKLNLLFIDDLTESIYNICKLSLNPKTGLFQENESPILNISSSSTSTIEDIHDLLSPDEITIDPDEDNEDFLPYVDFVKMDTSKIKNKLNFTEKYSLEEGISKTYTWFKDKNNTSQKRKSIFSKIKNYRNSNNTYIPLFENIIIFAFLLLLNYNFPMQFRSFITDYIDINYIYIIFVSIIYGNNQAPLSIIFSTILYISNFLFIGGNAFALIYNNEHIIHTAFYVILGGIIGYFISKYEKEINSQKYELNSINNKYDFLSQVYNEALSINEILERQIVNSKDSFTKLYQTSRKLESLEPEEIFTGSLDIIENIMDTKMVAIFILNEDKSYLRLKVRSNTPSFNVPTSINLSKNKVFANVINNQKLFANNTFKTNEPIFAYPLVENNKVLGVIAIYQLDFYKLTRYYENLFVTIVNLINDSLIKAYKYDKAITINKYVQKTKILTPNGFNNIIKTLENKKQKFNIDYVIIKISYIPEKYFIDKNTNINNLSNDSTLEPIKSPFKINKIIEDKQRKKIISTNKTMTNQPNYLYNKINYSLLYNDIKDFIRVTDYLGIDKNRVIYASLYNTNKQTASIVISRLKSKNIQSYFVNINKN